MSLALVLSLVAVVARAQNPMSMDAQLVKDEMGEELEAATEEQNEVAMVGVDQHTKDLKVEMCAPLLVC